MSNGAERAATQVIDAAVKLHMALGPGLLESTYTSAHLRRAGLKVDRERWVTFEYDGMTFTNELRIDLIAMTL